MGKEAVWDHDCALGAWGEIGIELVQTNDNSPAAYYQAEDDLECKMLNVAWGAEDIEAERARIEALGYPMIWESGSAERKDRVYMFDAEKLLGCLVQVYEANEATRKPYEALPQRRDAWDGKDPIMFIFDCAKGAMSDEEH